MRNVVCGCGTPFKECPFWQRVVDRAFGGAACVNAQRMLRYTHEALLRRLPLLIHARGREHLRTHFAPYLNRLSRLYEGVQAEAGCDVIVDSSKVPLYAYLLDCTPGCALTVLHLTRDARGAGYSCLKSDLSPRPLTWNVTNVGSEMLRRYSSGRYVRARYEDFARRPQATVKRVLAHVPLSSPAQLPFEGARTVHLRPTHTVAGNPNRHKTGAIPIRLSDSWKAETKPIDQLRITALTAPLLWRYGYPTWPSV